MPHLLHIGAVFPWSGSAADRHYRKHRSDIKQALATLSCRLWRTSGVSVPEPGRFGSAWLFAGRLLNALAILSGLCLIPFSAWLSVLFVSDKLDYAIIPLLWTCAAAMGALLALPGVFIVDHANRLLLRVPLDLSPGVASARSPRVGRRLKRLGTGLAIASLVVVSVAAVTIFVGDPTAELQIPGLPSMPRLFASAFAIVILAAGLLVGGIALFRRGRATLQPTASELLTSDRRRPVLLLRSFSDEDLSIATGQAQGRDVGLARLEETIADRFAPFGPMVAVGNPSEALPTLGAAREYYLDTEWRQAILGLMEHALLIVVIAGLSSGLRWELEAIERGGHHFKLLVLMPQSDRRRRWETIHDELQDVPAFAGMPPRLPRGLLCLHAAGAGDCTMLTSSQALEEDYDTAIDYALYGLLCKD